MVCFLSKKKYISLSDLLNNNNFKSVEIFAPNFSNNSFAIILDESSNCWILNPLTKIFLPEKLIVDLDGQIFDRNGFKYTGRIKALADAAREAGLDF